MSKFFRIFVAEFVFVCFLLICIFVVITPKRDYVVSGSGKLLT